MPADDHQKDLAALRALLAESQGKEYWRSLEELAGAEAFQESLRREFPSGAAEWDDAIDRRHFLQLMGASLALAGLTACTRQPPELIVPYVHPATDITLGVPLYFATAMPVSGAAVGLVVKSHEGRPTKIEGNPQHPASLGATSVFAQASILTLYNPDRARVITSLEETRSWAAFTTALQQLMAAKSGSGGAGLRLLTGDISSPTLADQLKKLLAQFPAAKWHQYEPVNHDNARMASGQAGNAIYRFENADVILALDSDFLIHGPASVRYAREFANRRRLLNGHRQMNRLYVVESSLTSTGALADHRLPLRPSEIESFARAVAARLGVQSSAGPSSWQSWIEPLARDLEQHRGSSLVIAGDAQPPAVHALAAAMNQALGAAGNTVVYTAPVVVAPIEQTQSLAELARDIDAGQVDLLVIVSGNPVYDAPVDLKFAERMAKVKTRVHLSLFFDETSELCHWHIPESHYLESWSDARAYDGTMTIIQPLIAPLYDSKSAHEIVAALSGQPDQSSHDIVRSYWMEQRGATAQPAQTPLPIPELAQNEQEKAQAILQLEAKLQPTAFDLWWQEVLRTGVAPDTALQPSQLSASASSPNQNAAPPMPAPSAPAMLSGDQNALEIIFRPDPSIYDGRFAHNGWLQELPRPLTKLTWGNAVEISPATAAALGLSDDPAWRGGEHGQVKVDVVELEYKGRKLTAPVWIMPGHADGCATVYLGYGRGRGGSVGTGLGYNAYALRTSDAPWFGQGLTIRKTGERQSLASTQLHYTMEGRALARSATLDEFRQHPNFAGAEDPPPVKSLYSDWPYNSYAWGMSIDLNACIGCNSCVVACQAENNIPVVGIEQVMHGREMHWIRIDRYFTGAPAHPEAFFQPVPCMHCENAPCELVCPVGATVHSSEGLNEQVYNRCVGTRYCSNNCPYKVRRFNFFLYQDWTTPQLKLQRNPDVTVRSRGVMEKCTYCVQRIQEAKITSEKEERRVRDGEIKTACQQACPTEAIVFGDINDQSSRVSNLKREPRNYALLAELNTRPRTTYLAAVRNPNPEIKAEKKET